MFSNFSKDLRILTTSRHLVHFNLQIALGLTQIVFLVGGISKKDQVIIFCSKHLSEQAEARNNKLIAVPKSHAGNITITITMMALRLHIRSFALINECYISRFVKFKPIQMPS